MGIITRLSTVIKSKMSSAINNIEDPREVLDYSYEQQADMLREIKQGIVDVTTAKHRLQNQRTRLQKNSVTLENQAREAVKAKREDLARFALDRKYEFDHQIEELATQIATIEAEEQKLKDARDKLALKVEAFRARKESIKAQYSAAAAQMKIHESLTGIGGRLTNLGDAIERSENKIDEMRARSSAIEELVDTGAIEDFSGSRNGIDSELVGIARTGHVESELERLKAETTV